jgi:hypothetical protein
LGILFLLGGSLVSCHAALGHAPLVRWSRSPTAERDEGERPHQTKGFYYCTVSRFYQKQDISQVLVHVGPLRAATVVSCLQQESCHQEDQASHGLHEWGCEFTIRLQVQLMINHDDFSEVKTKKFDFANVVIETTVLLYYCNFSSNFVTKDRIYGGGLLNPRAGSVLKSRLQRRNTLQLEWERRRQQGVQCYWMGEISTDTFPQTINSCLAR